MKEFDRGAYLKQIQEKAAKQERRREIGSKMLKVVGKALGKDFSKNRDPPKEKQPEKSPELFKSAYVQSKQPKQLEIGQLTPNVTPGRYVMDKRKQAHNYDLTNQRKKIKAPYRSR